MLFRTLSWMAVTLLGCAFAAQPLAAQDPPQDCAAECHACGSGIGWEGRNSEPPNKDYDMDCVTQVHYCVACRPENRVGDAAVGAEEIVRVIKSTSAASLREALDNYRDRLLFSSERNLAVVKGSGCNPDALATVLFLQPDKAKALRALGLSNLKEYLSNG